MPWNASNGRSSAQPPRRHLSGKGWKGRATYFLIALLFAGIVIFCGVQTVKLTRHVKVAPVAQQSPEVLAKAGQNPIARAERSYVDFSKGPLRELTSSGVQNVVSFSRWFTQPIEQLCRSLENIDSATPFPAVQNPVNDKQVVCWGEIYTKLNLKNEKPSSVFVWIQGDHGRHVELVRVKINIIGESDADKVKDLALSVLQVLHDKLRWDLPPQVAASVKQMQDGVYSHLGVSYKWRREWSDIPRLNIIIKVYDGTGIISNKEFTPRLLSGLGSLRGTLDDSLAASE